MGRPHRVIDPEGAIYHITCRGNNRQRVFNDETDYRACLDILAALKRQYPFLLYHYVLMPNHYHLLLDADEKSPLPDLMKKLNYGYSMFHRKRYGRKGRLWEHRYWSRILTEEGHLAVCGPYIELNPVRAEIVKVPEEWLWSSYRHNVSMEENSLVDPNPYYFTEFAGDTSREYEQVVRAWQLAGTSIKFG